MEAKLTFSAKVKSVKEMQPGQQVIFLEQEKEAEKLTNEMQILNQIAEMMKDRLGEDVIELNPEELENLKATEAELEEFNKKTVCFVERNEETGAVEITPGKSF